MAIHMETRDQVGLLTLDRPEKAHAYDRRHLEAMAAALDDLDPSVRVLVVHSTGSGAFCAGADLDEMSQAEPEQALDLYSQRVFTALAHHAVVSIAVVQGAAIAGGFELALACDLRILGPLARFALPETSLGIIPSAGGTTRLTRMVGPARAKEVILGGRVLDAEAALDLGLGWEIVVDPLDRALELARHVSERDPVALRLAKQIIDRGEDASSLEAERVAEALLYSRKQKR
ncbi:MAG: enoyl-CoA hydratase/isomerase family protein [Myxococcota bacterium]|jgi:enoyl-CoA hydratase|nr:enoyl-CoA hydratase/isomerase family protein [Myxococcota bacterium]